MDIGKSCVTKKDSERLAPETWHVTVNDGIRASKTRQQKQALDCRGHVVVDNVVTGYKWTFESTWHLDLWCHVHKLEMSSEGSHHLS